MLLPALSRATVRALKEYAVFIGCMHTSEAKKILGLEEATEITDQSIRERAAALRRRNKPKEKTVISPYIWRRIENAEAVLRRDLDYRMNA